MEPLATKGIKNNNGDMGMVDEQDREDEALYCDAHVVNIKRGVHDHRSCNCVFVVRYEFDGTEVNSLI